MAAGKPIEPYWEIYQQHYSPEILNILEKYKIGTTEIDSKMEDPYINDPNRINNLKVHKNKPYNAESDLVKLRKNYLTPNENIFVRNHHPVPIIDYENYNFDDDDIVGIITPDKDIVENSNYLKPAFIVFHNYELILK